MLSRYLDVACCEVWCYAGYCSALHLSSRILDQEVE